MFSILNFVGINYINLKGVIYFGGIIQKFLMCSFLKKIESQSDVNSRVHITSQF